MSTTKYINDAQIRVIEEFLPDNTKGVWRLCCETGIRISDALNARYCDFDNDGNFHYIAKKTGKKGVAKVSQDFLKMYVGKKHSKTHLFLSPLKPKCRNIPVTRQTVFNHIKKACEKAGIDSSGIAPHSARKHFAVEEFHKNGLSSTMRKLQHENLSTTLLYALSDDALHEILRRISVLEKKVKKCEKDIELCADELFGDSVYYPARLSEQSQSD